MKSLVSVFAVLMILSFLTAAQGVAADEPALVQVNLASGRVFTAAVDVRSDAETLWLRFESGAVRLWRPVKWDHVSNIHGRQGELTKAETLALASRATERPLRRQDVRADDRPMAQQANELLGATEKVTAIDFTADVANWDGDVTADGLELSLQLENAAGRSAAVAGSIEVQWFAVRHRGSHTPAIRDRSAVQLVGRWTRSFTAQDIATGVTWRLPFQAVNPDSDLAWAPMGLVSVKVTLPPAPRGMPTAKPLGPLGSRASAAGVKAGQSQRCH